ncbi:MAG: YbaB/EbfC family nucleoid-associated protein [Myxococcales bacterium]|nr:YbaB/EbfC family nucleoid-associated protein [Myxococcales bacterium]
MSNIKGGFNSIVRKAQKMQAQLTKLQEELSDRTVEAQVGGGAVKVTVNGERQVVGLEIEPGIIDPEDRDALIDLLKAGFNEAMKNVSEVDATETNKVTGGVNMPWML